MRPRPSAAVWLVLLTLLLGVLYPALVLDRVVAPEVSLRGQAPWRLQWGPFPAQQPQHVRAATELGARLSLLERDAAGLALWNPWIGGGRPGWLASAREGGAPLPLLAVLLSRDGMTWTGLLALQLVASCVACTWMLRRLGVDAWPAALGGLCYALSGPLTSHWLDWQGSAFALGPFAVALALGPPRGFAATAARWGGILAILGLCGQPIVPFVALAAAAAAVTTPWAQARRRLESMLLGGVLAMVLLTPRVWLQVAGLETGSPVPPPVVEESLPGLKALVAAPAPFDPSAPPAAQRHTDSRGYLGLLPMLLAGLGLVLAPSRQRVLWGGVLVASLALAFAPQPWFARLGMATRPLAASALATATLAAWALSRLTCRMELWGRTLTGTALGALITWMLLPVAATHVPFAPREEVPLSSPLPAAASPAAPRVVGLLGCLPPDVGAAFGLSDVRASFFAGEPRYAGLLAAGPGGTVSVARALSAQMAALGVGTLLEPLPLRVVSSEIFSRIELEDREPIRGVDGSWRRPVRLRPGSCRLGIPATVPLTAAPVLSLGARAVTLASDHTLAAESDEWHWFALDAIERPLTAELLVPGLSNHQVPLVVDHSGLRLVSEGGGVRVWSWDHGTPFASLAWPPAETGRGGTPCPGRVSVRDVSARHITVQAHAREGCSLRLLVKHRPALWRATVNGQPAQTLPCADVWACVPVTPGDSLVELRASLPWPVVLAPCAGLAVIAALCWVGRKQ